ncbi:MAG: hypothetical protein H0Z40_07935 [Desulfotomaculum sp.]|nr:hypothetical protein [Desulfotomaculum sp.]
MKEHVGEIIESSTAQFTCEAARLHSAPDYGSLVKVDEKDYSIIGVVFNITTVSADPSRRPAAYGQTEEELRRYQPQIFQLLRTYFDVLVIGYYRNKEYTGYLPPQPARIHSFVYSCSDAQYLEISKNFNYISTILTSSCESKDELAAAVVRSISRFHDNPADYQRQAGKELRRLLMADYERFKTIVRRIIR